MAKISIAAGQSSGNLNFRVAQKMVHRLLTHERIKTDLDEGRVRRLESRGNKSAVKIKAFTKKELAEKLGVSQEDIEKLESPSFYDSMASKISLSLSRLYCATKFADGEHKGE
ncbi:hypothetical protein GAMM_100017 [Gammaproteobacteria bacterium]